MAQASHTVNMPHTCSHHMTHMQATTWPREDKEERGEGVAFGLCPAILPSSFLPLHLLTSVTLLGLGLAYSHLVSLRPPQGPIGAGVSVLERKG